MKRRRTAILLALGLCFTAVLSSACGSSQASSTADAAPAVEETEPEEEATEQEQGEVAQVEQSADQALNDEGNAGLAPLDNQTADESAQSTDAQADANAADAQADANADAAPAQPAAPVSGKFHCELTEAGGYDNDGSYRVTYDSLVHFEGEDAKFCSYDGSNADSRPLSNMEYMGWGLYSVSVKGDDINCTGLVNVDGEVIIPFEAAIIEWPHEHPVKKQPRYVLVFTGTETTDDESEALFFATDRMFAIMANEEDTFYKGTLKVFDLEARKYVDGLEFTKGSDSSFAQVGDNILTDLGDKDTVYSPDGKVVYTGQSSLYYNSDCLMDRIDTEAVIMDSNGKEISRSDSVLNAISYNSPYFLKYQDSKYTVIDSTGVTVLSTPWSYIYDESLTRFRVKNDGDSDYSLVAADNTLIAQSDKLYAADILGFFAYGDSDNYSLITPDNRIYEGLAGDTEELFFTKDDGSSYLLLNTGEFADCPGSDADGVLKGIFRVQNDDGKYALYDTFTGEELLGFEYDEIKKVNSDYIYAVKDGSATIYKLTVTPDA